MDIINYIIDNDIGNYKENQSIANYTTYRVGGIVKVIVHPKTKEKLQLLMQYIKKNNLNYKIIGNGSNLLFSDNYYDGVIIKLNHLNEIKIKGNKVYASSGVKLLKLAFLTADNNLSGLERISGIPATIGGIVYMNAGCYDSMASDIIDKVYILDDNLNFKTLSNKEMNFGYRTSLLKIKNYICLGVSFNLKLGNKEDIRNEILEYKALRLNKQPINYPNAGSVFKNPKDTGVGRIIDELGLKGYTIGGAMVSLKHANFIINYNKASSNDILNLINYIKKEVELKKGIKLELEQELVNW